MDPLRIAIRVVFTFVFVLVLIRASGKRTISHGDLSSFVVAIVIGDLFDDFFWAEVGAAEFVVAVGTIGTVHIAAATSVTAGSTRGWHRRARQRT